MTIEETREIVRALVDDPHTSVDDVMIAVDAAMLAVLELEEVFTYDQRHKHKTVEEGCCRYHDIRRRIEELGK